MSKSACVIAGSRTRAIRDDRGVGLYTKNATGVALNFVEMPGVEPGSEMKTIKTSTYLVYCSSPRIRKNSKQTFRIPAR
jgi:hypothetical protein